MMVYGNFLTKLPFVDEKSFIIQPVLTLQDYFIKRWKENLPNDDAEKYTDWYVFRLMAYIMNTSGSTVLYGNNKYSFEEVIKFNEKAWETIENMVKYEAKDKMFQEIRYAAFNNLSIIFTTNFLVYWAQKKQNELIIKDVKQHERLIKLYDYIKYMDNLYSSKYPEIYNRAKKAEASEYFENERLHRITSQILYWQILTKRYQKIDDFCQADKNMYLKTYMDTISWFLKNEEYLKTKNIDSRTKIKVWSKNKLKETCKNLNL